LVSSTYAERAVVELIQQVPKGGLRRAPKSTTEQILGETWMSAYAKLHLAADRSLKCPARFPGRAHFVSFNFPNSRFVDSGQRGREGWAKLPGIANHACAASRNFAHRLERRVWLESQWRGGLRLAREARQAFTRVFAGSAVNALKNSAHPYKICGNVGRWVSISARRRPLRGCSGCGRAAPLEVEAPSVRGTLTPNPAPMEADQRGIVYRVSHVVDGEFAELLRRN
jgi:hypothetical protein